MEFLAQTSIDWTTISNIGSAGTAVVIVVLFLKYLKDLQSSHDQREESRMKTLETIGDACHEQQRQMMDQMTACVNANNEAIHENTVALGKVLGTLDSFDPVEKP